MKFNVSMQICMDLWDLGDNEVKFTFKSFLAPVLFL